MTASQLTLDGVTSIFSPNQRFFRPLRVAFWITQIRVRMKILWPKQWQLLRAQVVIVLFDLWWFHFGFFSCKPYFWRRHSISSDAVRLNPDAVTFKVFWAVLSNLYIHLFCQHVTASPYGFDAVRYCSQHAFEILSFSSLLCSKNVRNRFFCEIPLKST